MLLFFIMREFILSNGISTCIKQNKDTPRTALTLNVAINKPEKYAGEYSLMNRLLLKKKKKETDFHFHQVIKLQYI